MVLKALYYGIFRLLRNVAFFEISLYSHLKEIVRINFKALFEESSFEKKMLNPLICMLPLTMSYKFAA